MHALSQLSYGPKAPNCSREIEILGPVHPELLVVLCWLQPELNGPPASTNVWGQEVSALHVGTERRDQIDLVTGVAAVEETFAITSS